MKVLQIDISWTNYVQVANDLNVSSVQNYEYQSMLIVHMCVHVSQCCSFPVVNQLTY